ncbi:MAG: DUF4920 domain-containing protein [Acidobacteriota bacterium]
MKNKIFSWLAIVAIVVVPVFAFKASEKHFGAAFNKDAKVVKLAEVTANPDKYNGKTVKLKGKIADVCQREGCWLVLTDGERTVRVNMKDHAFVVPKDSGNKEATVEGIIEKKEISEEMARHYAEESAGKVDPSTIKGPQVVISVVATGVRISQ